MHLLCIAVQPKCFTIMCVCGGGGGGGGLGLMSHPKEVSPSLYLGVRTHTDHRVSTPSRISVPPDYIKYVSLYEHVMNLLKKTND